MIQKFLLIFSIVLFCWAESIGQDAPDSLIGEPGKAVSIIAKAAEALGGQRYLNIRTQVSKGKFSVIRDGTVVSFQSFDDIIVFSDRGRTDFKSRGIKTTQVNTGDTGWIFDGDQEMIRDQSEIQIGNFKRGIRTSLDNLLRGHWKGDAELSYIGRRPAALAKRNDVIKLTYSDGFEVEFEFGADDNLPQKAIYKRKNIDGEDVQEEDRFAQYIEVNGIRSPFVIDRFSGGKHTSRINFESLIFDRNIPDSVFEKPSDIKAARKDIKY